MLASLAACGGGSDGGGSGPSAPGPGVISADNDPAPIALTEANQAEVAASALGILTVVDDSINALADLSFGVPMPVAASATLASATVAMAESELIPCESGTVAFTGETDAAGLGTINATFSECLFDDAEFTGLITTTFVSASSFSTVFDSFVGTAINASGADIFTAVFNGRVEGMFSGDASELTVTADNFVVDIISLGSAVRLILEDYTRVSSSSLVNNGAEAEIEIGELGEVALSIDNFGVITLTGASNSTLELTTEDLGVSYSLTLDTDGDGSPDSVSTVLQSDIIDLSGSLISIVPNTTP